MNRAGRGIDAGARAVADEWPRLGDVNVGTNRGRIKMNEFIFELYLLLGYLCQSQRRRCPRVQGPAVWWP